MALKIPLLIHIVLLAHTSQYGQVLPHSDDCHPLLRPHARHVKMGDDLSQTVGHHIDPGDTLSNAELAKLILKDTSIQIADLWRDVKSELDLDRDHNKKVNEQIVEGLCKRIDILEKYVLKQFSEQSKLLTDLDLKIETVSIYQEQIISNLDSKVHSLIGDLKNHEKSYHRAPPNICCGFCELTFKSKNDLEQHLLYHHANHLLHPYTFCGSILFSEEDLNKHPCKGLAYPQYLPYPQGHDKSVPNSYYLSQNSEGTIPGNNETALCCNCSLCGLTFSSSSLLDDHVQKHHRRQLYPKPVLHCSKCERTFEDMVCLNIHTKQSHTGSISDNESSCTLQNVSEEQCCPAVSDKSVVDLSQHDHHGAVDTSYSSSDPHPNLPMHSLSLQSN